MTVRKTLADEPTLNEFFQQDYFPNAKTLRSIRDVESRWRLHIAPAFGHTLVTSNRRTFSVSMMPSVCRPVRPRPIACWRAKTSDQRRNHVRAMRKQPVSRGARHAESKISVSARWLVMNSSALCLRAGRGTQPCRRILLVLFGDGWPTRGVPANYVVRNIDGRTHLADSGGALQER